MSGKCGQSNACSPCSPPMPCPAPWAQHCKSPSSCAGGWCVAGRGAHKLDVDTPCKSRMSTGNPCWREIEAAPRGRSGRGLCAPGSPAAAMCPAGAPPVSARCWAGTAADTVAQSVSHTTQLQRPWLSCSAHNNHRKFLYTPCIRADERAGNAKRGLFRQWPEN